MKTTVFWDIAPCSLLEVNQHVRDYASIIRLIAPDDSCSKYLWKISKLLHGATSQKNPNNSLSLNYYITIESNASIRLSHLAVCIMCGISARVYPIQVSQFTNNLVQIIIKSFKQLSVPLYPSSVSIFARQ